MRPTVVDPGSRAFRAAGIAGAIGAAALALACGGAPPQDTGPKVSPVPLTRVIQDEPDDGVEVVGEKGHMDAAAADAALAPHQAAMSRCYTQKVGRRTWLGGRVVLHWEIAADGAITSVRIAESDLGAWPIESCLLGIAREVTFSRPVGGKTELTLPLELSTARPLPISEVPPVFTEVPEPVQNVKPGQNGQNGKTGKTGKTGKAKDGKTKASKGKGRPGRAKPPSQDPPDPRVVLDACAETPGARPNDVVITLYATRAGRIESVGFASATTVIDEAWATCAEATALTWRLEETDTQVTKHLIRYRSQ